MPLRTSFSIMQHSMTILEGRRLRTLQLRPFGPVEFSTTTAPALDFPPVLCIPPESTFRFPVLTRTGPFISPGRQPGKTSVGDRNMFLEDSKGIELTQGRVSIGIRTAFFFPTGLDPIGQHLLPHHRILQGSTSIGFTQRRIKQPVVEFTESIVHQPCGRRTCGIVRSKTGVRNTCRSQTTLGRTHAGNRLVSAGLYPIQKRLIVFDDLPLFTRDTGLSHRAIPDQG